MRIAIVIILIFSAFAIFIVRAEKNRDKQDCEYFKDFRSKNIPARCLSYYEQIQTKQTK